MTFSRRGYALAAILLAASACWMIRGTGERDGERALADAGAHEEVGSLAAGPGHPDRSGLSREEREKAEAAEREKKAWRIAAEEEMRRVLEEEGRRPPPMTPIAGNGELPIYAIQGFKLTEEEAAGLREAIRDLTTEESRQLVARARRVSTADGGTEYRARAKRDRGVAAKAEFARRVEEVLGKSRAEEFLAGMGNVNLYGYLGAQDVDLRYYLKDGKPHVTMKYYSPETGRLGTYGDGPLDDINWEVWGRLDFSSLQPDQ